MINNNTQPNSNLKPTMTSSYELGLELKFFNGRLGVDFTYYNQTSKDQIIALASSSASGYANRLVNAGKIQNKGIELAINGRVLQIKDFAWDAGINFSKNSNKVLALVEGMDYLQLADASWAGVSVGAEVGKNYGSRKELRLYSRYGFQAQRERRHSHRQEHGSAALRREPQDARQLYLGLDGRFLLNVHV